MPGIDAFEVEGTVVEVHANRTFRVRLANGHCLTGFITSRHREVIGALEVGHRVRVRLSAYDLSVGRIFDRVVEENL